MYRSKLYYLLDKLMTKTHDIAQIDKPELQLCCSGKFNQAVHKRASDFFPANPIFSGSSSSKRRRKNTLPPAKIRLGKL